MFLTFCSTACKAKAEGEARLKNSLPEALGGFVDSSTEVSFATFRYLGATAGGLFVERVRALEGYCYARSVRARSAEQARRRFIIRLAFSIQ